MKSRISSLKNCVTYGAIFCFVALLFLAVHAVAQGTQGQDAVYPSNGGGCSSGSNCAGSSAFIDASQFLGNAQSPNFCSVLNYVLTPSHGVIPPTGAVIDARALPNLTGLSMTCTASPWAGITTQPSTILLPATAANPIVIPGTWVLPAGTHLIGQGDNVSSGTTIQAASTFTGTTMIAYCSSTCNGVALENLILDGKGGSIDGIVNEYAGSLSYVDHVSLYQILGAGLLLSGVPANSAATGSGPYTNITFNTGSFSASTGTVCMQIRGGTGLTGTAGIRGLRCIAQGADGPAAMLLDASNNSIKDVSIAGFKDGILVGSIAAAANNVLINVIDDTTVYSCGPPCVVNVIDISSNNSVSDITMIGVSNQGGEGTSTIVDNVTQTTLSAVTDPFVALYALGKGSNNGYARFTTSLTEPTWASGTVAPSSGCTQGSLYSCTGTKSSCTEASTAYALFGCPIPGGVWAGIK